MDPTTQEISAVALVINIFCLYGFGALAYIIPQLTGQFRRGFFCDDDSIRMSFHDNTVPASLLVVLALLITIIAILSSEFYIVHCLERQSHRRAYRWRNASVAAFLVESTVYFGYSQVGFVAQAVLTQIAKYSMGRLRPHFLDVCKPEGGLETICAAGLEHKYITDYKCTGIPSQIHEARLSFFSGHSATAVYSAVFCVLYLQCRLGGRPAPRLLLPMVQTLLMGVALYVCFTRITDNWHHWSDVLVGAIVGTLVAVYTAVFWADLFSPARLAGYSPDDPVAISIVPPSNHRRSGENTQMTTSLSTMSSDEEARRSHSNSVGVSNAPPILAHSEYGTTSA